MISQELHIKRRMLRHFITKAQADDRLETWGYKDHHLSTETVLEILSGMSKLPSLVALSQHYGSLLIDQHWISNLVGSVLDGKLNTAYGLMM